MPCQYQEHCTLYETLNYYRLLNNSRLFPFPSLSFTFRVTILHAKHEKKQLVPGCDVLIPLVLIDGLQRKNPPRTGTLLLCKKPRTTPTHDTLMLCKLWKYFKSVRVEKRSKDWTTLSVLDCITSFSQPNQENVAPDLFFGISDFGTLVCSGRY